jgi:hypothetical protein
MSSEGKVGNSAKAPSDFTKNDASASVSPKRVLKQDEATTTTSPFKKVAGGTVFISTSVCPILMRFDTATRKVKFVKDLARQNAKGWIGGITYVFDGDKYIETDLPVVRPGTHDWASLTENRENRHCIFVVSAQRVSNKKGDWRLYEGRVENEYGCDISIDGKYVIMCTKAPAALKNLTVGTRVHLWNVTWREKVDANEKYLPQFVFNIEEEAKGYYVEKRVEAGVGEEFE